LVDCHQSGTKTLDRPFDKSYQDSIAAQTRSGCDDEDAGMLGNDRINGRKQTRAVIQIGTATDTLLLMLANQRAADSLRPRLDARPLRLRAECLPISAGAGRPGNDTTGNPNCR